MTTTFTVYLEAHLDGFPAFTTCDVVEAPCADDAETKAIAAWRAVEPTLRDLPD